MLLGKGDVIGITFSDLSDAFIGRSQPGFAVSCMDGCDVATTVSSCLLS